MAFGAALIALGILWVVAAHAYRRRTRVTASDYDEDGSYKYPYNDPY